MGLLGKIGGKIGDKINEKIDETLNPKVSSTNTNSDWKEEYSKEKSKTFGKELAQLEQQMNGFYQNDSYNDLLDCCLKILSIDAFHHNARELEIDALIGLEMFDKAYKLCIKLLEEYPNNNNFLAQKGEILYRSGKLLESIPIFEKLIQKIPYTNPLALNCKINKAYALSNTGNFEEAVEFCEKELKLHENDETLLMIKNKVLKEIQKNKEQNNNKEEEFTENKSDYSIADQISKFNKLKEEGVITEEEFTEMKKKLMDKM
jgi:tetratricopeptide (TPR) repeat protein